MEPYPKENDQEAVQDSGHKSSPSIGEKLKELLTAKPTSYSEDEEPRRAEKEQMAPQEEFVQEPQPSKNKEVDERSAIRVSDQEPMIADGGAVHVHPSRPCGDRRPYEPLRPPRTYYLSGTA